MTTPYLNWAVSKSLFIKVTGWKFVNCCFREARRFLVSDMFECNTGVGVGGHQRWLQLKTAGSGQGVAGLNRAPGNPFRGQVCLLKERQSSSFEFSEAVVQDIPLKKLSGSANCNVHLSHSLAVEWWRLSVYFSPLYFSMFVVWLIINAKTVLSHGNCFSPQAQVWADRFL